MAFYSDNMNHYTQNIFLAYNSKSLIYSPQILTANIAQLGWQHYKLEVLRSIHKLQINDHFSYHWSVPKNQVPYMFIQFICNLQNLLSNKFIFFVPYIPGLYHTNLCKRLWSAMLETKKNVIYIMYMVLQYAKFHLVLISIPWYYF